VVVPWESGGIPSMPAAMPRSPERASGARRYASVDSLNSSCLHCALVLFGSPN
jgi:hypothetical protein